MEKTPSQYEHTRATGQDSKPTTGCLKTQVSAAKGQCTTKQPSWQWDSRPQIIGQMAINGKVSTTKKAKAQPGIQVGNGTFGYKTTK